MYPLTRNALYCLYLTPINTFIHTLAPFLFCYYYRWSSSPNCYFLSLDFLHFLKQHNLYSANLLNPLPFFYCNGPNSTTTQLHVTFTNPKLPTYNNYNTPSHYHFHNSGPPQSLQPSQAKVYRNSKSFKHITQEKIRAGVG